MSNEDKNKLINKSYNDSLNNYNLFEKRFTNIINSNNFNIKNVNFNKQQNITKDNSIYKLNLNLNLHNNIVNYYLKTHILKDKYMNKYRKIYFNNS